MARSLVTGRAAPDRERDRADRSFRAEETRTTSRACQEGWPRLGCLRGSCIRAGRGSSPTGGAWPSSSSRAAGRRAGTATTEGWNHVPFFIFVPGQKQQTNPGRPTSIAGRLMCAGCSGLLRPHRNHTGSSVVGPPVRRAGPPPRPPFSARQYSGCTPPAHRHAGPEAQPAGAVPGLRRAKKNCRSDLPRSALVIADDNCRGRGTDEPSLPHDRRGQSRAVSPGCQNKAFSPLVVSGSDRVQGIGSGFRGGARAFARV